ncbi:UPF0251 domain protein [Dehalogenimonas sp. WBC-2]|nr:UPF0251 domain protein [Dehalogenimonas sp. WBC-2]
MARPIKCRAVEGVPGVVYFKPAGIPLRMIEDVELPVEEYEAIRLRDMAGLEQEDCAAQMGVSRPTFQRILNRARRHIAEAITQGKALKICGGNYSLKEESGIDSGSRRRLYKEPPGLDSVPGQEEGDDGYPGGCGI